MTRERKIFWTAVTVAILVGYFALFFWMKSNKAHAEDKQQPVTTPAVVELNLSAKAYFAGGCFWCVEKDFEKLTGVGDVISGYTGGDIENPTYEQISKTETGHREAVEVPYDPDVVTYQELVHYFLRHIDPLDAGGQFCDRGFSYMTAIWVGSDEERTIAEAEIAKAEEVLGKEVVTPVLDVKTFWNAEDYHQDFYKKSPLRYNTYRYGCGRDARVDEVWGMDKNH